MYVTHKFQSMVIHCKHPPPHALLPIIKTWLFTSRPLKISRFCREIHGLQDSLTSS